MQNIKNHSRQLLSCLLLSVASGLVFVTSTAQAVLNIEITQGVEGAVPVSIVPFGWEVPQQNAQMPASLAPPKAPPVDIAAIVSADLERTGRFEPLPPKDMLARPHVDSEIKFSNWRIFQSENLVVGTLQYMGANRYKIRFRLFDVFKGKQLEGFSLSASGDNLRQAAHQVSDIIYEKLTGERGAFTTSVAYVTASGQGNARRYSLWIADADGFGPQSMMRSGEPILSPAWSPDGTQIAYASLEDKGHQVVFVQNVASGRREKVSFFKGINGAPSWSPDGKSLAVSLSKDGNPEIYVINLANKKRRRLTKHWAIDTEPTWTPDGKTIIFTSDRGGRPQLYQVAVTGGRSKRLTFEGQYNAKATVSRDGKKIAMIHRTEGKYRVAIMDRESGNLRVLTDGVLDESPSFAPNGSMIIYATSKGRRGILKAVSVDGSIHQQLTVPEGDVREPAWSPFTQ
ncbi:MAG: Tol-Pal system beta propeller repeat protein TolB [Ectothiorhodospiraceae bacterium]|nr:Tol-Pal system beta propeller repeat protein TolB [Ectothiorhodospiraceae bacterium]